MNPPSLDNLPEPARGWLQAELDAGNALLEWVWPPADVQASQVLLLALPLRAHAGATLPVCFGELAPGLPAVVVLVAEPMPQDPPSPPAPDSPLLRRFRRSLAIDFNAWHDGIGYDLDALREADPADQVAALHLLRRDGLGDWRDVQALACMLPFPAVGGLAEVLLRRLWHEGTPVLRMAVLRHAPQLVGVRERRRALVQALAEVQPFEGLSECLEEVRRDHPPMVLRALWAAAAERPRSVAVHCAALLAHLHGLTKSTFDLALRPLFLRCGSEDPAERAEALAELRRRLRAMGARLPRRAPPALRAWR